MAREPAHLLLEAIEADMKTRSASRLVIAGHDVVVTEDDRRIRTPSSERGDT
jgi:hypothetical protein